MRVFAGGGGRVSISTDSGYNFTVSLIFELCEEGSFESDETGELADTDVSCSIGLFGPTDWMILFGLIAPGLEDRLYTVLSFCGVYSLEN